MAALLVVLGLCIYLPYLSGEFFWDDEPEIICNPRLRDWSSPWRMMTEGELLPPRPLPYLTFAGNLAIFGLDNRGFRAVNLAIHLANGLLIFGLIDRLARLQKKSSLISINARPFAAACALLWTAHPVAVQVVSYAYQRQESLTAFLMLTTLWCFVRFKLAPQRPLWLAGSYVACGLAMTCKETAVVTPILIILIDYYFFAEANLWRTLRSQKLTLAGYFATWVVLAAVMYFKRTEYVELKGAGPTPFHYLLTQSKAILHYVAYTFAPTHLAIIYSQPVVKSPLEVLPQLGIILIAIAASIWGASFRNLAAFCGCWFFIVLAPTSSVMPINHSIQDYRIYLATLSLILPTVYGTLLFASWLGSRSLSRIAYLAIIGVAVSTFAWQAATFAQTFQTALGVWQSTYPYASNHVSLLANLGDALNRANRSEETILYLQVAANDKGASLEVKSAYLTAMKNVGREQEAIPVAESLASMPDLTASAHLAIGNIYRDIAPDKAIENFEQVIALDPKSYQAFNNIGTIYARTDPERGAEYLRRSLEIDPSNASAHLNLGNALARMNQLDAAIESYDNALELEPENATAQRNRQVVAQLRDQSRKSEAKTN